MTAVVVSATIPQQHTFGERRFPLVLTPEHEHDEELQQQKLKLFANAKDVAAWANSKREDLRAKLLANGAILFRGFPLNTPEDFSNFVEALGVDPLPYVGGAAPRNTVFKHVHTTNESPPDQPIPFHHEMAQVPTYPKTVLFFCEVEPAEGGETPICPSDVAVERFIKAMPKQAADFEKHGVVYTRVIPEVDDPTSPIGRGWISTFQTKDTAEAEKVAQSLGVSLHWLPNGDVKTVSGVLPAIKTYPATGKKVWFNSVVAAYTGWKDSRNDPVTAVRLGNGDSIDPSSIAGMKKIMSECCASVPWKKGDVMWLDNEQTLHSRSPFVPPRRILAYLGKN